MITKAKKLYKKIKNLVKYHYGPKEVEYDHEMNKFVSKKILDTPALIYVVSYDKETKYYRVIIQEYNQEYDVWVLK